MNLSEQRGLVSNILDYSPTVEEYVNEVTNVLNEIYKDFFTDRAWKFAQKTVKLSIHADSTATDGQIGNSALVDTATDFFESWMAGGILEISGSTDVDGEYEILSVVSTTRAKLGDDYAGSLSGDTGVTFIAKQRYIDLPADCAKVLSLQIRDYTLTDNTSMSHMPRGLDEAWLLDIDRTGSPTDWLLHDDLTVDQPVLACAVSDGGVGALGVPKDGEYEVAYTYVYQNRESALSPSVSITMSSGDEIDISGLPNTGTSSGMYKQLYFKHPDTEAWYKADNSAIDETTTTATLEISSTFPVNLDRAPEHEGYYNRVRLYPRQDDDYNLEIRYLYQPNELVEDSDVPEFPPSSHRFLAYKACEELFIKHGNLSQSELYRRKSEVEWRKLANRYLSEKSTVWVKTGFDGSGYQRGRRYSRPNTINFV